MLRSLAFRLGVLPCAVLLASWGTAQERETPAPREVAKQALERASALEKGKQPEKALAALDEAVAADPKWAETLDRRGLLFLRQKEYARAVDDFTAAIAADTKFASAYSHRAQARLGQADYVLALADAQAALQVRNWPEASDEAICVGEEVAAVQAQLLEVATRQSPLGDKTLVDIRIGLINTQRWLANRQEAREDFPAALATRESLVRLLTQARGPEHWEVVNARLALAYVDRLANWSREQRSQLGEAESQLRKSDDLYRQGRFREAVEPAQRAIEVRKQLLGEQDHRYADALVWLAWLQTRLGDSAQAEPLYRQTLEIRKQVLGEKHLDYARSLNNLANLYRKRGNYAQAEPLYRQALEIKKQVFGEKHPDYAGSLNNLAILYEAQAHYAQAEPLYRQVLEIEKQVFGEKHPTYAVSLNNLAGLYRPQGNYAQAELLCRQALDLVQTHLELTALIQSERQQLAMAAANRFYLDNYLRLGAQFPPAAEPAYRALLRWKGAIWVRQREGHSVADHPELLPVFKNLQSVAMRLAKLALTTPDPKNLDAWRRQLEQLTQQKEELEQELARRSAAWREAKHEVTPEELAENLPVEAALIDFLESQHHLLAFVVRRDQTPELLDLGPVAPTSEAIDRWRETWGRGDRGRQAGQLLRERLWLPLEGKLAGAKLVLVSPDGVVGRLPLAALPGSQPGTYLLEERSLITLPVPQALPALLKERSPPGSEATKNLLLLGAVDYESDEQPPSNAPAAKKKVFGRRAERGADWRAFPPLAGTEGELASLEKTYRGIFADDRYTILEKAAASKEHFVQEAPRHLYLHVATHGFFAPPNLRSALQLRGDGPELERLDTERGLGDNLPRLVGHHPGLLSGLALAGANRLPGPDQEDGILTAEEVQTLDLRRVELAVLSACETGLGEVAGGEGLLGLQRAFQVAGARTTVASLWTVDDVHTRALMERVYNNLWEKDLSKLEALREAQLWMLREGHRGLNRDKPDDTSADARVSPYYWAAFVLSGDWR